MARPLSCHDTKLCIATLIPNGQALARVSLAFRAVLPYRGASLPYRGRAVAVSWRAAGRIVAPVARLVCLCHDSMHCIVTQMGSSPSSLCTSVFFFTSFFSSHSSNWKTTKENIYIYIYIYIYIVIFQYTK